MLRNFPISSPHVIIAKYSCGLTNYMTYNSNRANDVRNRACQNVLNGCETEAMNYFKY